MGKIEKSNALFKIFLDTFNDEMNQEEAVKDMLAKATNYIFMLDKWVQSTPSG